MPEWLFRILLAYVWKTTPTVKNDWSRLHAAEVAIMAVRGYITTQDDPEEVNDARHTTWGNTWRVTPKGLAYLWKIKKAPRPAQRKKKRK